MAEVRKYCSLIHKKRKEKGFESLRYPLITATLNRYFLPEHRALIAEECNLIGYMGIPAIEYEPTQIEEVILDITKSDWQEELCKTREEKNKEAKLKKENAKMAM